MQLSSLLTIDSVLPQITVDNKKQALKLLAARSAELTGLNEREIFNTLMSREEMGCTAMGNGVCIPHGRFAGLHMPVALFASLTVPIEFGAADGKLVDLVFLLLTPAEANTEHLKALATISKLLRDKSLRDQLRATSDTQAMHRLLTITRNEDAA